MTRSKRTVLESQTPRSSADRVGEDRSFQEIDESYIQIGMIALMAIALAGGLLNRRHLGQGMGERSIQFVGAT